MPRGSTATYGGMVHSVVESTAVLTNLASGGCRGESCACSGAASGWWCGSFSFGLRPYACSRVGLTEGRRMYNSGCGGVPLSRASTVSGMTLQCLEWWHSGGDGHTGSEVTEETLLAVLTSRRRPGRVRSRRSYAIRGFHRPLSRAAMWRWRGGGRHSISELTPAFPHSSRTAPGMVAQRGLVEQCRGMIPRRRQRAGVAGIRL
jgi:hypothetical protein